MGIGVLLLALLSSGCSGLPADAVKKIQEANRLYETGRFSEAQRLLDQVTTSNPQTRGVAEAYYIRGLCRLKQSQTEPARSDFQRALGTSDRADLTGRINAQLGHLCYLGEDYAQAVQYYERAVKELPNQPPTDEVYYRYGDSLQRIGQWQKARTILPKVWQLFPHSRLEPYARRKFSWPHDHFSIQCGAFRSATRAQELARQLRSQQVNAAVDVNASGDTPMHTVYVGAYPNYADAARELSRVRGYAAEAIIVP